YDVRVPRQIHLHHYAADIARAADGQWWIIADRAQTGSGAGYALENRTILARCLPEVVRACGVRRITGFFDNQRELLANLSPRPTDTPRIIILTAGPRERTYFEHAFLARHLGFPLVTGSDLTVRE